MAKSEDLFSQRKSLDEICTVPEKIISVYSLEKHVWADSNSEAARRARQPEPQTMAEFQLDPVRSFLMDILRNMAAPYRPERRDLSAIGQGYWIQAEFGSGKSHLLCALSTLALGSAAVWDIVREKEQKAGRGKRESLYQFWEEGLQAKSQKGQAPGQPARGIFVIVKTLVGAGGGTVGLNEKGRRLSEYILDAAREQLMLETGKNLSLYPTEVLADRFIAQDVERYRKDLNKFMHDPSYFEEDEFEEVDAFIRDIQQNKSPEYKRSCGNKLWRFYTEYLKVQPQVEAEIEDVLKHLVETILAEGYAGVLLVLDEVSLFMKNRDEGQRTDDEQTLVVLSNRLAKVHNLPLWTVCAAQQAIESKMGVRNIIADDRLKLVKLLDSDQDYYDIVLARVREITTPSAIHNYYLHYKRGFTWPNSIGEAEFARFFPFHKPALEVLRAITYELTTTRSAIHFMHQTLKHQIKQRGKELIRLWELFDETVRYEEEPSGVHAGLVAIKTKREAEYRAYEACRRQIEGLTKGHLKVYRDKAIKTVQTLFLVHVAHTRQQGITPEEIANAVLIERDAESNVDENIQHYETLAENLKKELRQIVQNYDEEKRPRYRFEPVYTGVDPRFEFQKARDEAEGNEVLQGEAWAHLLALDEWPVRTRQMTLDLSSGVKSILREIAPRQGPATSLFARTDDNSLEIVWQGRMISGQVGMRDLARLAAEGTALPGIASDQTDQDFAVWVSTRPVSGPNLAKLFVRHKDPRVLFWTPDELTSEERDRLLDFAAYRRLVTTWGGKEDEDAVAVINWVSQALQTDMARMYKIVETSYARGRMDALNNTQMPFHVAGELGGIVAPLVDRILAGVYASRAIKFEPPFQFRKEEAVKVINGIVKTGRIPKGAKPNQDISAAQNFGLGLQIIKRGAEKELDVSDNPFVQGMWDFIEGKLADEGQSMKMDTLYKNFSGIGGPKDYGLSKRLVQLYLLCLVQQGKVRVNVGPRAGLPTLALDYANIAQVDFSAKVLDNLSEVQKLAKPENWEVLRPYAEKLLSEAIASTHDDAQISAHRSKLRELFANERDVAVRLQEKSTSLFAALQKDNPYATEITQMAKLFATDLAGGNDIDLALYGLQEAFGYQAFVSSQAEQSEVDDLANRLRNYHDVQRFLAYDSELRAAQTYGNLVLPDVANLEGVHAAQREVARKLNHLQPYIDSDVHLKTELVGQLPTGPGETGTIGCLISLYTAEYLALHDQVLERVDACRLEIQNLQKGGDLQALEMLERITALQPSIASALRTQLGVLEKKVFACGQASATSVRDELKRGTVHSCGLTFTNYSELLAEAQECVQSARTVVADATISRMSIFLNPAVRQRLEQGRAEPLIAGLLQYTTVNDVWAYLAPLAQTDPTVTDKINRYLKRITVKKVSIAGFRPSHSTVEKGQIADIALEFAQFLEEQLLSTRGDEDTLPMLQLE